jgi:hypothetical protein
LNKSTISQSCASDCWAISPEPRSIRHALAKPMIARPSTRSRLFANGAVGVFLCHAQPGRLCAGWVGTHDMSENFALRIAALDPNVEIDPMVYDYQSPQPLYGSGAEAAAVGLAGVAQPSREAKARVEKLLRKHKRLREPKGEGKRNAST